MAVQWTLTTNGLLWPASQSWTNHGTSLSSLQVRQFLYLPSETCPSIDINSSRCNKNSHFLTVIALHEPVEASVDASDLTAAKKTNEKITNHRKKTAMIRPNWSEGSHQSTALKQR
mmetsp:Transcript_15471/g.42760  ORF Transcript_15471/g.42760 Transcript_15471/m.42760 type:complete len:116 (-) Transcript_15471:11-358(-)